MLSLGFKVSGRYYRGRLMKQLLFKGFRSVCMFAGRVRVVICGHDLSGHRVVQETAFGSYDRRLL